MKKHRQIPPTQTGTAVQWRSGTDDWIDEDAGNHPNLVTDGEYSIEGYADNAAANMVTVHDDGDGTFSMRVGSQLLTTSMARLETALR